MKRIALATLALFVLGAASFGTGCGTDVHVRETVIVKPGKPRAVQKVSVKKVSVVHRDTVRLATGPTFVVRAPGAVAAATKAAKAKAARLEERLERRAEVREDLKEKRARRIAARRAERRDDRPLHTLIVPL